MWGMFGGTVSIMWGMFGGTVSYVGHVWRDSLLCGACSESLMWGMFGATVYYVGDIGTCPIVVPRKLRHGFCPSSWGGGGGGGAMLDKKLHFPEVHL